MAVAITEFWCYEIDGELLPAMEGKGDVMIELDLASYIK